MSKIISEMPEVPKTKYPWDEWFDGQTRLLEPGVDFHVRPDAFRSGAYARAKVAGLKVTVLLRSEGVYLQAHPGREDH